MIFLWLANGQMQLYTHQGKEFTVYAIKTLVHNFALTIVSYLFQKLFADRVHVRL